MKKVLKFAVICGAVVFVGLQLFQIEKTNPQIVESETLEAAVLVSPDVSLIIGRACNDCHTNKTVYPWYAYIQPAGWFLKGHIDDGKAELNLSKFNTYEKKKKVRKLEEMCSEVESGQMPLPSYTWIHRDAILTDSEKKAICSWTKTEIGKLENSSG